MNLTDNKMFDDRGHGDGGVSVVNLVTFHSLATYANSAAIYCAAVRTGSLPIVRAAR